MSDREIDWRWCQRGAHYWGAETGETEEPPADETFLAPSETCPRHERRARPRDG